VVLYFFRKAASASGGRRRDTNSPSQKALWVNPFGIQGTDLIRASYKASLSAGMADFFGEGMGGW
jgi:hypothetical protein